MDDKANDLLRKAALAAEAAAQAANAAVAMVNLRPGSHQRNMEDDIGATWDATVRRVAERYIKQQAARRVSVGSDMTARYTVEQVMLALRAEGVL